MSIKFNSKTFYIVLAIALIPVLGVIASVGLAQGDSSRFITGVGPIRSLGNIEFVEVNTPSFDNAAKQLIVFVHGTPGSLSAFLRYVNDPVMRESLICHRHLYPK